MVSEAAGQHLPVMVAEVLRLMKPRPGQILADLTLGCGMHGSQLLKAITPGGLLLGMDRDPAMLAIAERELSKIPAGRFLLVNDTFGNLRHVLEKAGYQAVDGILADLGISSAQLDSAERGMSYRKDGLLDCRMNTTQGEPVWKDLETLSVDDLAGILFRYGEETQARRIAEAIARERVKEPIRTTGQLTRLLESVVVPGPRRGLHGARRTYLALRAWKNSEPQQLEQMLGCIPGCLKRGGIVAVISYHSLEDAPTKAAMKRWKDEGRCRLLTNSAIKASDAEIASNPRARSARLRAAMRI